MTTLRQFWWAPIFAASCYGPPVVRPDRVYVPRPKNEEMVAWGQHRIVELKKHGRDAIYILAKETPRCRSFARGEVVVVDHAKRTKREAFWLYPGIAAGGVSLALGILMPVAGDKSFGTTHFALIGSGAGVAAAFGIALFAHVLRPDARHEKTARTTAGGRWIGPGRACGDARALVRRAELSASLGKVSVSWTLPLEEPRTVVPHEIVAGLTSWANSCRRPLAIEVTTADADAVPSDLSLYEAERQRAMSLQMYRGSSDVEVGASAGIGHGTVYGESTSTLELLPDALLTKPAKLTKFHPQIEHEIVRCLAARKTDFIKQCRDEVRSTVFPECEQRCKSDRGIHRCDWGREDCQKLGGSAAECSLSYDTCLRELELDPVSLRSCAERCADEDPEVVRAYAACDLEWQAQP